MIITGKKGKKKNQARVDAAPAGWRWAGSAPFVAVLLGG
jgi:hypothetical protein